MNEEGLQARASGHNVRVVAVLVAKLADVHPGYGSLVATWVNRAIAEGQFTNERALGTVANVNELRARYSQSRRREQ